MRARVLIAVAFAVALSACKAKPAIKDRITLDFTGEDAGRARVTTLTEINSDVRGAKVEARVAATREAILAARDEWSPRFASVAPSDERIVFDKQYGLLTRAEHSGSIERDAVQRFFADLPMTVTLTRGEGWSELAIYPGASTRATREQREHVNRMLEFWSADASRYIDALSKLYDYLDTNPERAQYVFALLFDDEGGALDKERALIERVNQSMAAISDRIPEENSTAMTIDEEFDLVFNPFPAEIDVRVPRPIFLVEGFEKQKDDLFVIKRAGLLEAIEKLEGKWVSPDLLAISLREQEVDPKVLAAMPRKSSAMVTATEIEKALRARLAPASGYRVRWSE
jgi:hypothetical protein